MVLSCTDQHTQCNTGQWLYPVYHSTVYMHANAMLALCDKVHAEIRT